MAINVGGCWRDGSVRGEALRFQVRVGDHGRDYWVGPSQDVQMTGMGTGQESCTVEIQNSTACGKSVQRLIQSMFGSEVSSPTYGIYCPASHGITHMYHRLPTNVNSPLIGQEDFPPTGQIRTPRAIDQI